MEHVPSFNGARADTLTELIEEKGLTLTWETNDEITLHMGEQSETFEYMHLWVPCVPDVLADLLWHAELSADSGRQDIEVKEAVEENTQKLKAFLGASFDRFLYASASVY